jgi:hypothetical protein
MILSLILLNLAGGDCISDIGRLEQDAGFKFATHGMKRTAKSRCLASNASIHRYLPQFHLPEEEKNRVDAEAFIPKPNNKLKALIGLNSATIITLSYCNIRSGCNVNEYI